MSKKVKKYYTINNYIKDLSNFNNCSYNVNNHPYLNYFGDKQDKKDLLNNLSLFNVFNELMNLSLNIFKWDFKENIYNFNERVIELALLNFANITLFNSADGVYILGCKPNNKLTRYGEPTEVNAVALNGDTFDNIKVINDNTKIDIGSVINTGIYGYDNKTKYCYINYVIEYAYKISDKMRALDILTQRLKSPFTFKTSKENVENIKRYIDGVNDNDEVIFVTGGTELAEDISEVIPNNFNPALVTAMKEAIIFDFDKFLEKIGVNVDPNPDKKERKLVDEIKANNKYTNLTLDLRYDARKNFCEKCKNIFNIDIDVKINENITEEVNNVKNKLVGDENGSKNDT